MKLKEISIPTIKTIPPIMQGREYLRPYHYDKYERIHLACIQSPWSHLEVGMKEDVIDWEEATELTRIIIAGILRGFTLIELGVGCYWRKVADWFPHPEISMLAATFSHQETIHSRAYDHQEATLGLETYEAFKQDETASRKFNHIMSRLEKEKDIATSLAIFSGGVEGVSLFSSFAILLSFTKEGKFKGNQQILSWSVNEELTHSSTGISLYHDLISEAPYMKPRKEDIYMGFDAIVENEMAFVENIFGQYDVPTISKAEVTDFIRHRANLKLMELKFPPKYKLDGNYRPVKQFFDTLRGKTMNDFFAQSRNGSAYTAMLSENFEDCNFGMLI